VQHLSVGLSVLLMVAYGLGLVFTLKTHREIFGSAAHGEGDEAPWPMGLALATLAGVTVLVALISEVFVESVQGAALELGLTPAFVGFIVVALVGGAAEMASAFSGARKDRLDLSVERHGYITQGGIIEQTRTMIHTCSPPAFPACSATAGGAGSTRGSPCARHTLAPCCPHSRNRYCIHPRASLLAASEPAGGSH